MFQLAPYSTEEGAPNLDPELIMFNPSSLASQLRLILYGSRLYPELKPDSRHPAPNIAHYVWLGGGEMSYTFFLSVLRRHKLEYLDDGKFQTFFFGTVGGCKKKITSSHAVVRFDENFKKRHKFQHTGKCRGNI